MRQFNPGYRFLYPPIYATNHSKRVHGSRPVTRPPRKSTSPRGVRRPLGDVESSGAHAVTTWREARTVDTFQSPLYIFLTLVRPVSGRTRPILRKHFCS